MRLDGDDKSEELSKDISRVIDVEVEEFARSFGARDRVRIAERLKQMENRTYLLLFLTIDIIETSRSKYAKPSDIESLLEDLPDEFSAAYEKILNRSPDKDYAT